MKNSIVVLASAMAIAVGCGTGYAKSHHIEIETRFQQLNLVSDLPGEAMIQDGNLLNAWGISFSPTGPFWVSANGTAFSTIYSVTNDVLGNSNVTKVPLEVDIPGEGSVTGQVYNRWGGFNGDIFLFASEDGTISGWRPDLGANAEILVQRPGAVYKGITVVLGRNGPIILAANFSEGTVDEYGPDLTLLEQFRDNRAPDDYAPFNIQTVGGELFVTFAKQDEEGEDDVPGPGNGLIDTFNLRKGKFSRVVTGTDAGGKNSDINSPWGLALAPKSCGKHEGELLVGNFGSGTIMALDSKGKSKGLLEDVNGDTIVIDGLWGLSFGNGGQAGNRNILYFTAGSNGEADGLFGSLRPTPVVVSH